MLGHATGRLLLKRDGYKVDLEKVLTTAAETGTLIEINASPVRLDLDWIHAKRAKALGVKLVINPDAHAGRRDRGDADMAIGVARVVGEGRRVQHTFGGGGGEEVLRRAAIASPVDLLGTGQKQLRTSDHPAPGSTGNFARIRTSWLDQLPKSKLSEP